jgi:predicted transcriptional regulator
MTYAAKYRASQIKTQITNMAKFVVDIITEQIQKEHIEENMPKTVMQKGVTYKLPPTPIVRREPKLCNSTVRAIGQ